MGAFKTPHSRRSEAGVSLVETAIIMPLVMLLLLGILEGALLFRTYLSASNASNGGARLGAIQGNANDADWDILQAIVKDSPGASENQINGIIIYKAAKPGDPPSAACLHQAQVGSETGIAGACNVYSNYDLHRPGTDFGPSGYGGDQFWPPQTRSVSLSAGTDYLGVWVQMQCQCMATSLFGISPDLHSTSIAEIEPKKS